MSSPVHTGSFVDSLPTPQGDAFPMTRDEAKAKGLRVFLSKYRCLRSSKHGQWRLVSSNRCADCVELEANLRKDLKASVMDRLRAEAERKVRKEMASMIAEAERQARDIIKAAEKVAMGRAKVLEKAKATLAANRAKKAAEAAAMGSNGAAAGAVHAPRWEGPEEGSNVTGHDDFATWD